MADSKLIATEKVASIVAPSQLAITGGKGTGVQVGDEVVLHRVVDVIDPDTQENLGTVQFPRLRLKINLVSAKFSTAYVLDKAPTDPTDLLKVAKLKTLTLDPAEESDAVALIVLGEKALVRREPKEVETKKTPGNG